MNIYEAIEVMKIVAPCASKMMKAESGIELINILLNTYSGEDAVQLGRLAALMFHEDLGIMTERLKDANGQDFASVLAAGLVANPIHQLLEGAYIFQFVEMESDDA